MSFLEQKWSDYHRQSNPPRRYASQREFEADWVNGLRRRFGLSQEALAARLGVSVTTIQNWENPQSHKHIAGHNQDRLRDVERDLWMQAHVTLMEPCPPYIRALHDLLAANRDASAQGLADYLLTTVPHDSPERPRLLHWAGLAHGIANPAAPQAREYARQALAAIGSGSSALAAAIENEILGSQFEELLTMPDGPRRRETGQGIMAACERLFQRDQQPAYLWNALETACRAHLPAQDIFRLVTALTELLGEQRVRHRILAEDAYAPARSAYAEPATLN